MRDVQISYVFAFDVENRCEITAVIYAGEVGNDQGVWVGSTNGYPSWLECHREVIRILAQHWPRSVFRRLTLLPVPLEP